MRPYDLLVRMGGDEFVCAMANIALPDMRGRIAGIGIAVTPARASVALRAGYAELAEGDTAEALVAWACREPVGGGG